MKFLHTSDWQLGMNAAHVGEVGAKVREARLNSAKGIVQIAKNNSVEFVLIAGDLFNDNGIDRPLIQKTVDILNSFACPVYVIPGNHDPLVSGSVWEYPAWESADNINIFREETPYTIQGGIIYPCPARGKHSRRDPTIWINHTKDKGIGIGLAHGSLEGIQQEEPDYPIPKDAAIHAGLNYLALGHWHSTLTYATPGGGVRMAYSGTHETTKFGEPDSGNVLLIEIKAAESNTFVTQLRAGLLTWSQMDKTFTSPGDLMIVRTYIENIPTPQSTLLNVVIKGLLFEQDHNELSRLKDILGSRFLYTNLDMSMLRPAPQDTSWLNSLPHGIIQEVARKLEKYTDINFVDNRPEGASPEIATQALLELHNMVADN